MTNLHMTTSLKALTLQWVAPEKLLSSHGFFGLPVLRTSASSCFRSEQGYVRLPTLDDGITPPPQPGGLVKCDDRP